MKASWRGFRDIEVEIVMEVSRESSQDNSQRRNPVKFKS
ncbi:hypothetical protein VD0002_g7760 [Verticillium dahliae]|uniref:Uncharacterized protein n=2 Tax=Verticillium dahliae TaxID=27337 RepID=G2WSA8_VERDV|nr:uncharacterized protein VDAG_00441 [Verticillium dahliae VdLs.17]EGY13759.1 hypothetical protein VDAG_00441 [Verticillium dahliae VdLs.17]PNH34174.1 hypothetical protein BJF96_g2421 [Verticillium dahliae]PNH50282.1 hypothetical protein VD0003_g6871 [Verticillium dahliae]PNH59811.1 hypothetical protein VD0002_g7760 [Verticillium dahliae]